MIDDFGDGPQMLLMALCIRCGVLFGSDPDTVPSVSVHAATRCPVRPDGTQVKPGDIDAHREPLCPACAGFFLAHGVGKRLRMSVLFPHARTDLIRLPVDVPA